MIRRPLADLEWRITYQEELRLGQYLHGTLCQTLPGISLLIHSLVRRSRAGKKVSTRDLCAIQKRVDSAVEEARLFAEPRLLAENPNHLPQALGKLAQIAQKHMDCSYVSDDNIQVPKGAAAAVLFRLARESVQGGLSGENAGKIEIRLRQANSRISLEIARSGAPYRRSASSTFTGSLLRRLARTAGIQLFGKKSGDTHTLMAVLIIPIRVRRNRKASVRKDQSTHSADIPFARNRPSVRQARTGGKNQVQ